MAQPIFKCNREMTDQGQKNSKSSQQADKAQLLRGFWHQERLQYVGLEPMARTEIE
jgi:hypothetical protein